MLQITRSEAEGVVVLSPAGRLDPMTSAQMTDELSSLIQAGKNRLVLSLGALEYISSAGLRALLMGAKQVEASGGKMVLCELQDYIKEVFDIAGFGVVMPIVTSLEDARRELEEG